MNKKTIKLITCVALGAGVFTTIPFAITSCKNSSAEMNPLPDSVFKIVTSDQGSEIEGFKYSKEELLEKYPYCNTLKIPSTINGLEITSINKYAFADMITRESYIPNNITKLNFSINSNIKFLPSELFLNAPLKTINFTNCNDDITIQEECFFGCDISKLILKNNSVGKKYGLATNLGPNAKVLIEKKSDGQCIFDGNTCSVGSIAFGDIVLPKGISEYKSKIVSLRQVGAFQGCHGVKNVEFNSEIEILGSFMFSDTGILSLDLSKTKLSYISEACFQSCLNLSSVILPNNLKEIRLQSFEGCLNLSNVDFSRCYDSLVKFYNFSMDVCPKLDIDFSKFSSDSLTIGNSAFATTGCTAFCPSHLSYIGNNAFFNCKQLKIIDFTKYTSPSVRLQTGNEVFSQCNINKDNILLPQSGDFIWGFATNVDKSGWALVSTKNNNNFTFTNDSVAIMGLAGGDIKINDNSLTKIAPYAFNGSPIIGVECQSIKEIGDNAFYNCAKLKNIDFTTFTNLEKIYEHAFGKCSLIRKIDLSNSKKLSTIKDYAFFGDKTVNELVLPSSLTEIGKNAFYETSINKITWNGLGSNPDPETTNFNSVAFASISKKGVIKLESGIAPYTSEKLLEYFKDTFYDIVGGYKTFSLWTAE